MKQLTERQRIEQAVEKLTDYYGHTNASDVVKLILAERRRIRRQIMAMKKQYRENATYAASQKWRDSQMRMLEDRPACESSYGLCE